MTTAKEGDGGQRGRVARASGENPHRSCTIVTDATRCLLTPEETGRSSLKSFPVTGTSDLVCAQHVYNKASCVLGLKEWLAGFPVGQLEDHEVTFYISQASPRRF